MYNIPQYVGAQDCSYAVDPVDVDRFRNRFRHRSEITCDVDVYQLSMCILEECNIAMPTNPEDGCVLYKFLRKEILEYIDSVNT